MGELQSVLRNIASTTSKLVHIHHTETTESLTRAMESLSLSSSRKTPELKSCDLVKSLLKIREALDRSIANTDKILRKPDNPWMVHSIAEEEEFVMEEDVSIMVVDEVTETQMQEEVTVKPSPVPRQLVPATKRKRRSKQPSTLGRVCKVYSEHEFYSDNGVYRHWPVQHCQNCHCDNLENEDIVNSVKYP